MKMLTVKELIRQIQKYPEDDGVNVMVRERSTSGFFRGVASVGKGPHDSIVMLHLIEHETENTFGITCDDVEIVATISCSDCGKTDNQHFGGEAPTFFEEFMGDSFGDEGWTIEDEWYGESEQYHKRRIRCPDCVAKKNGE
jgi:hypothetical protein